LHTVYFSSNLPKKSVSTFHTFKIISFKLLMNKIFLRPIACCCSILILTSCATTRFDTRNELTQGINSNYIAIDEVSVGDWITYIVTTSFTADYKTIKLGDHLDKIQSKLPVLKPGGWSHYTINAFLRNSQKNVSVDFYNDCKGHIIKIEVAKTAWDSIRKYQLLDLPIAGITYEQARHYIGYKQYLSNSCALKAKDQYRYECFLPTPEEFASAQTAMDSLNNQGCNLFNYKNSFCADCPNGKKLKNHPVFNRTGTEPTYVWAYFPDPFGVKNFKGNVAEMTSIKGIAEGGSCMHYAFEAFNGRRQEYLGSATWLGLRVWYKKIPKS